MRRWNPYPKWSTKADFMFADSGAYERHAGYAMSARKRGM